MGYLHNILKRVAADADSRRLADNFFSLSVLQFASYVVPLVTFPYLVRVLGPDGFGLVAFAAAFIQYFNALSDYGFNFSATSQISVNREDRKKISDIFNAVMAVKFMLTLAGFIALCVMVAFIPRFRVDWPIYIASYGIVIGNTLFPAWFFQGMERMRYVSALHIIAKTIFTFSVFLFVKSKSDIYYVPLAWSSGFIIAGLISLYIARRRFGIIFTIPGKDEVARQISEGWHVFASTIAVNFYTTSNTVILGFFANNTVVGYYSAAEKMMYALVRMLGPFSQAVFPHIGKMAKRSRSEALSFLRRSLLILGGSTLAASALLFIFSGIVVKVLLGGQYAQSVILLRIMSFTPFFIAVSNILGMQTMLNFGMKKAYSRFILTAAVYSLALALALSPALKAMGMAFCVISTETFLAAAMYMYLVRKGILPSGFPFAKVTAK